MCGIAGFCDFSSRSSERVLSKMTDVLRHRGPDDRGTALFEAGDARVGLGNRRLSILDLSSLGHQPMFAENEDFAITLNGEIYNFREIRAELEALGSRFASGSDTEVILHGYIRWGVDVVHKLIGMFAFAIYDRRAGKLRLFRDRAGVKPLYFYWHGGTFLFASELKSFHEHPAFSRQIDLDALALYLKYGFVPAPHAIFRDTFKVRPGHYLTLDIKRRALEEVEYWSVLDSYNRPKLAISEAEAEEELERLLVSAFRYRLVADVPVGLFLSSGIDSATVAALLQESLQSPLKTFTIGFEDAEFDEARDAGEIARHLGTDHTEHYCSRQDILDLVPRMAEFFDEPFGDSSVLPTMLVSEIARRDVKVALSGDGGDETFAGYDKYVKNLGVYRRLAAIPPALRAPAGALVGALSRLPGIRSWPKVAERAETLGGLLGEWEARNLYRYKIEPNFFGDAEIGKLLGARPRRLPTNYDNFLSLSEENDEIDRMLAVDYQTFLVDDVLVKVDRATMSVGLEGREPLLDHRIIELVARLPSSLKYRDGTQKYLLKRILHRRIPKALMDRRKKGFGAPIADWLKHELRDQLMQSLDSARMRGQGLFDPDRVAALRDEFLATGRHAKKVRFLFLFQLWWDRWM